MLTNSKLTATPAPGAIGQRKWTAALLPVALRDKYAPSTIALAMALIELHYNRSTGQLDPGYPLLAKELGVTERTIIRAANELEAGGWIRRHRLGRKDNVGFTLHIPDHEVTTVVTSDVAQNISFEVTRSASRGDTEREFEVTSDVTANEHLNTINTTDPSLRLGSGALTRASPKKTASRMIEGWGPNEDAWRYAMRLMPGADYDAIENEVQKFVNYWLADAGPRAYKRDWDAAFKNWVRKSVEYRTLDEKRNRFFNRLRGGSVPIIEHQSSPLTLSSSGW